MNTIRACWIVALAGLALFVWGAAGTAGGHLIAIVLGLAIDESARKRMRALGWRSWWERRHDRLQRSRAGLAQ